MRTNYSKNFVILENHTNFVKSFRNTYKTYCKNNNKN